MSLWCRDQFHKVELRDEIMRRARFVVLHQNVQDRLVGPP